MLQYPPIDGLSFQQHGPDQPFKLHHCRKLNGDCLIFATVNVIQTSEKSKPESSCSNSRFVDAPV
jgi:hypothetical protein